MMVDLKAYVPAWIQRWWFPKVTLNSLQGAMARIMRHIAISTAAIPFDPATDIPDLSDKVVLVTGGNNGLGRQSVCEYARHNPKHLFVGARNVAAAQAVVDEVHRYMPDAALSVLPLDLTSFRSVQAAARQVAAQTDRLDILMLNAGIMAAAPGVTEDGYEVQFGTNHMGHALLTKLLLPTLRQTPGDGARIVVLSSRGHLLAPRGGIDFDTLKKPADHLRPFQRYGQSKLANVLFAKHLAVQYPELTTVAVHPGIVRTNLVNSMSGLPMVQKLVGSVGSFWFTPVDQGAKNQLWASVSEGVRSGEYYEPVGVADRAGRLGRDEDLAKELWDWTVHELKEWSL
ncbi:NAD(P)-binding domain protein [Moelleriella libera RCEF 2490]|uniref:NAD(P)-binding domain protein n=1 Tax=Moelleriella libera RCEF 2490 TaxID=1081109 RepID=A0A166U7K0_9HYPO|nr:NAD(P)-binding domain protein [Moelleriella libera RCEF 2490]